MNGDVENVGRFNKDDPLIAFIYNHASIEGVNDCIGSNIWENKCFLNTCPWILHLFNPSDHLKYGVSSPHNLVFGHEDKTTMGKVFGTHPYDKKSFLEISNLLERENLCKERDSNKVECYRGVMRLLRLGIHVSLQERLIDYHGSSSIPLCSKVLNDLLVLTFWGYTPLIDHFDAWFYQKCMQPCHDVLNDYANPNPHAMSIVCLLVSPTIFQGLDLRMDPFQEGEDDTGQRGLKVFDYIF